MKRIATHGVASSAGNKRKVTPKDTTKNIDYSTKLADASESLHHGGELKPVFQKGSDRRFQLLQM